MLSPALALTAALVAIVALATPASAETTLGSTLEDGYQTTFTGTTATGITVPPDAYSRAF